MVKKRSGVVLTLATPAGRWPGPGFMGHSVACAGIDAMTRHLAGELGGFGVRVAGLRVHAIPEAAMQGSHSEAVFRAAAAQSGLTFEQWLEQFEASTPLKRLPTLANVADTAVFLASDHAAAMTGAIANLTCGVILDL